MARRPTTSHAPGSALRFRRKAPNPWAILVIAFVLGAAAAALVAWFVGRSDTGAALSLEVVTGTAVLDDRGRTMDLIADDGTTIEGLRITPVVTGRECVPDGPARLEVGAAIVNLPADELTGEDRSVLVGLRCLDEPPPDA